MLSNVINFLHFKHTWINLSGNKYNTKAQQLQLKSLVHNVVYFFLNLSALAVGELG